MKMNSRGTFQFAINFNVESHCPISIFIFCFFALAVQIQFDYLANNFYLIGQERHRRDIASIALVGKSK